MRLLAISILTLAAPAAADWNDFDYLEDRELSLDAGSVGTLRIDAGAGSLEVRGQPGASAIEVDATIMIEGAKGDSAKAFIESNMELGLERDGDRAVLIADFDGGMGFGNKSGRIKLEVTVPEGMALDVDDGSGSITIRRTMSSVRIDDGSGSIEIADVGDVELDDGSGSISVANASGGVRITDGSGSIKVRAVGGDVYIDDGSGSIDVRDVQGSFTVTDDGSGSINYDNVMGAVTVPED